MITRGNCFSRVLLLFLLLGCRPLQPEERATPISTAVVTPPPTPLVLPAIQIPTPTVGRGTIYGQILHSDRTAAPGLTVIFCQEFSLYSGCEDKQYAATTNADGTYVLTEVEPGHYALAIYLKGADEMPVQYASSEAFRVQRFEVERNKPLKIAPIVLFAHNLTAVRPGKIVVLPTPESNATSDKDLASPVELQWQVYPEAMLYEVSLSPERGGAIWVNEQVKADRITAVLPRLNCLYYWQVAAFDQVNVKIAASPNMTFSLTAEEAPSCHLALLTPQPGEVLRSTSYIRLDWEVLETAASYQIWLIDEANPQRPPILNYETVNRSRYDFPEGLAVSHYVWKVVAYDAGSRMIAESDLAKFEVIP